MNTPRIVVYGAGGIGGPLAAFLHRAGVEIVAIARGAHLAAIRERGLRVITPEAELVSDVPGVGHPREIEWRADDFVALTMKAQDTEAALRDLRGAGADPWTTSIFCVQNCIANEPIALRYFESVYGVMIVIPGIHLEPGVVHSPITGPHGVMDVGRYPRPVARDDAPARFVAAVRAAGYVAEEHANVMSPKGAKFMGNLGNAMGAITDGRGDDKPFMAAVRAEAEAVFTAAGLPWEPKDEFDARVRSRAGKMAPVPGIANKGSSWQSLMRHQGSIEADFLNGEVVLLGRRHGIPTPFNAVLQRVANEMAAAGEAPGKYTAEELTELASRS